MLSSSRTISSTAAGDIMPSVSEFSPMRAIAGGVKNCPLLFRALHNLPIQKEPGDRSGLQQIAGRSVSSRSLTHPSTFR